MDAVDKCKYADITVDKETSNAYRQIFSENNAAGMIVLDDLVQFCLYQQLSQDPLKRDMIRERGAIIARIKCMINGRPVEPQPTEELEP